MNTGDYIVIGVAAFLFLLGVWFFILWHNYPKFREKISMCVGDQEEEEEYYIISSSKVEEKHETKKRVQPPAVPPVELEENKSFVNPKNIGIEDEIPLWTQRVS